MIDDASLWWRYENAADEAICVAGLQQGADSIFIRVGAEYCVTSRDLGVFVDVEEIRAWVTKQVAEKTAVEATIGSYKYGMDASKGVHIDLRIETDVEVGR